MWFKWFKRSTANRRLAPGQKLQVKLRADEERAARTWWFARAVTVGAATVFALYILWCLGGLALNKFVYENPTFAIEQVDIKSDGVISPEQLRRWSGVRPGANLIGLDLAEVRRNLELAPAIASVSIDRILPRTLIIRVKERQPMAQANVPRSQSGGETLVSVLQLDVNGFVMQPMDPRQAVVPIGRLKPQFPVIVGFKPGDLLPGHQVTNGPGPAALSFITAFEHSAMAGTVDLQSVDISESGVLVATSLAGGEVTFATNHLDQQLRRWRQVYDLGRNAGKTIACMDLAVSNNVPVKWNFVDTDTEAAPKPKHPHARRKNV